MVQKIEIIGVSGIPLIRPGDNLGEIIIEAVNRMGLTIEDHDIVLVTQIIVSKAEGRVYSLSEFIPSQDALKIAATTGKDPRHVEAILREAVRIVRMRGEVIITETRHGFICANSGVDLSNVGEGMVALLPIDPDKSAEIIRKEIEALTGKHVAVIITDSHGRPFRRGAINVAVGCSGIEPIWDRRGEKDLYGRILRSKQICIADELASAAELVMGQADEGVPVAIIRGYRYKASEDGARRIIRPADEDLFR
ncbi:MAG: coenzyme F420-0:L-glutamate ligase [Nitrososphaerota archaeon]